MRRKTFVRSIATLMVAVMFLLVSCQKDIATTPNVLTETAVSADTSRGGVTLRNAVSQTTYEVSPSILAYFQHFCQRNAGPKTATYPNGTGTFTNGEDQKACAPTCAMMVIGCLKKYKTPTINYNVGATQLKNIYDVTKRAAGTGSISIAHLESYIASNEPTLIANRSSSNDRNVIKTAIQNALSSNNFVIVGCQSNVMNYNVINQASFFANTSANKDLLLSGYVTSGTTANQNYISDSNAGYGHIIIIVKVTVNTDGSGVIEYIDPLNVTRSGSNRRFMSYTRLLNSMGGNSSPNNANYQILKVKLK